MKIRILQGCSGLDFSYGQSSVVDVPDVIGNDLISGGLAEIYIEQDEAETETEAENDEAGEKRMLELSDVKEYLRIDHDAEDGYLSVLILLAKELCENYLRTELPVNNESVRQAELLVVSHFFENRSGGSVPDAVYRLLDAYRREVL